MTDLYSTMISKTYSWTLCKTHPSSCLPNYRVDGEKEMEIVLKFYVGSLTYIEF